MRFRTIIVLFLFLLVAIISIQNAAVVDVRFLLWQFSVSRILLIIISFVLGAFVGYLLSSHGSRSNQKGERSPHPDPGVGARPSDRCGR